ncbi:MAG: M28 family metallopeptidase [Terriglobia bacterium]
MKFFATLFGAGLVCLSSLAATGLPISPPDFHLLPLSVIEQRLKDAPRSNILRERALKYLFKQAGCAKLAEQKVNPGQPPNVICTLPGETSSLIIVGGHLDHVRRGNGIVDDWSGASMLPSLYQSVRGDERRHTFLFIGFTEEEKGLVGSKYYVDHLSKEELHQIRAMVNLECLGMGAPEVWQDHADPRLLVVLDDVAKSMGTYFPAVNLAGVGRDDAMSFRDRKVPTITIHSLTQGTVRVLHSSRDTFAAEDMTYYYGSYRLVLRYLTRLDEALP